VERLAPPMIAPILATIYHGARHRRWCRQNESSGLASMPGPKAGGCDDGLDGAANWTASEQRQRPIARLLGPGERFNVSCVRTRLAMLAAAKANTRADMPVRTSAV